LWAKIAVPVVVIIGIAAASNSDDKKDTPLATTGDTTAGGNQSGAAGATTKPPTKSSYAVGDTARTSDFDITVYGFKDPATTTNSFDKAKAGMLLGFHLVDGANRQYDIALTTITPGPPGGEIAVG